jgi:hypothetical protein
MRQRTFMGNHTPEIPAINPAAASLAFDEVFGLVFRRTIHALAKILSSGDVVHFKIL